MSQGCTSAPVLRLRAISLINNSGLFNYVKIMNVFIINIIRPNQHLT